MIWILKILYKYQMRLVLNQMIVGRYWNPDEPEKGRILFHHGRCILRTIWFYLNKYLPEAHLKELPTFGNQHNVFLAVLTTAGYHALVDAGINRSYAISLISDAGWKLYSRLVGIPRFFAGLLARDDQAKLNMILKMMMQFPFNGPGRPGYEVNAWSEEDHFRTDWTFCPPYQFVKKFTDIHGDHGEIEMFQRSWCDYDWAVTYAMLKGEQGKVGCYKRPHTISKGDQICDMHWYAKPQTPDKTNK